MTYHQTVQKFLLPVLLALAAAFAPIKSVLIATLALTLADMVAGILASKKSGIPITSFGLRRTVVKLFVYMASIVFGHILQTWMLQDLIPVDKIVAGAIGIAEFKSILENLETVSGQPVLQAIIEAMRGKNGGPTKVD